MSPPSLLRFHPDLAPMPFDDLLTDGESDARALVLNPTVQPPEGLENLLGMLGFDADAIVFHPKDRVPILLFEG